MKKFVDLVCSKCDKTIIDAFCEIPDYPPCPDCQSPTIRVFLPGGVPAVKGDDIPGGVWIKHGICNEDGTPRQYYSHSEIERAAREKGYVNQPERGVADKKDWDRLSSKAQINASPIPTRTKRPRRQPK